MAAHYVHVDTTSHCKNEIKLLANNIFSLSYTILFEQNYINS